MYVNIFFERNNQIKLSCIFIKIYFRYALNGGSREKEKVRCIKM